MESKVRGAWAWLGSYVASQVGTYFTVKGALDELGVYLFLPAYLLGTALILVAASRGRPAMSREAAQLGAIQALSAGLWAAGLSLLQPATSAIINWFMPFVAAGLAAALLGEAISAREAYGMAVAAGGLALMALWASRTPAKALGVALTMANTVTWASYSLYYRKLRDVDPIRLNAASLTVGGLLTLATLAFLGGQPDVSSQGIYLMLLSVLFSALGYVSWNQLMRSMKASKATMLSYAAPAAVAVAQAIAGSPPPAPEAAGLGLMVLGAFIAYRG